jgi:hypothetical protein
MAILTLLSSGVGPLVLFAISIQTTEDLADAVRDTLPSLPPAVLIPPFVLVFGADLVRRTTAGPLGRGWLYTIAMDTGLAAVLALVMFALAMALTGNIELALEQSRVMACIVLTWLVPLDLVVTAPSVVQRLRSDREWASLPIDAGKGAIA